MCVTLTLVAPSHQTTAHSTTVSQAGGPRGGGRDHTSTRFNQRNHRSSFEILFWFSGLCHAVLTGGVTSPVPAFLPS